MAQPSGEDAGEQAEQGETRDYATFCEGRDITFDPMKDLNLPGSYEEVLRRFRKLQGVRAMEVLN